VKEKITGPSPVKTFTINNNGFTNVFFRTISKGYHHIKNTDILGLKHKFISSRVDFNNNKERSHQEEMNNQATEERESPTIDTSQCIAPVIRNNMLKFHQDRTINC
jgi:hypothetical protein